MSIRQYLPALAIVCCILQPAWSQAVGIKEYIYLNDRILAIDHSTVPLTGNVSFPPSVAVDAIHTITATYTAGNSPISQAFLIFNEDAWVWRGCHVAYNPTSGFYLASDEFANPMWQGPALPQENSFCKLHPGSTAAPSGAIGPRQSVTVTFRISFKNALAGTSGVFAAVADTINQSSGWSNKGLITVTPANISPTIIAPNPTPSLGSGSAALFNLSATDADTNRNISWMILNIIDPAGYSTNCAFMFITFTKSFYVANDAYNAWYTIPNQVNTRCTLLSGHEDLSLGNTLLVRFNTAFNVGAWAGPRHLWGSVMDRAENYNPGLIGTYTIQ